jgi:hypothetical protein
MFKIEALIWVSFWRVLSFELELKGWLKSKMSIQEYKTEILNSYKTYAWVLWYIFPVQCEKLRLNHLTPLLVVLMPFACWFLWHAQYIEDFKWRLHFQVGVAFGRVVLREVYFEGKIVFEGHWRLQSWTLVGPNGVESTSTTTRSRCMWRLDNLCVKTHEFPTRHLITQSLHDWTASIELSFNSTWLLVGSWLFCLQNLPCLVSFWCMRGGYVVWRFEHRTFYIGSWRVKLVLACQEVLKWVWSSMNWYRMFYVKTSTLPPRMHQKLTEHGKICKQNNQLPTKSHVELKDNSNIWPKVSQYQ